MGCILQYSHPLGLHIVTLIEKDSLDMLSLLIFHMVSRTCGVAYDHRSLAAGEKAVA